MDARSSAPGMGRPLLLTTLERDEAMRVLTGGATRPARARHRVPRRRRRPPRRRRAVVPRRCAPRRRRRGRARRLAGPDPPPRRRHANARPGSRLRRRAAARDPRRARARRRQRPRRRSPTSASRRPQTGPAAVAWGPLTAARSARSGRRCCPKSTIGTFAPIGKKCGVGSLAAGTSRILPGSRIVEGGSAPSATARRDPDGHAGGRGAGRAREHRPSLERRRAPALLPDQPAR